jgi:hypothetical protein
MRSAVEKAQLKQRQLAEWLLADVQEGQPQALLCVLD